MSIYFNSIRTALFAFIFIAAMIMIPTMIVQYRKYGSVSSQRSLILYGFLFYIIAAYCLVILPLPARDSVHTSYREMMQLIPFTFISDFMRETVLRISDPSTYLSALSQGVVTQVIFNIFLTIPFGMFLRYYFKKSLTQTIVYSLLLSLFFELTQLSGLYFIYSGPYRLFDVDDLLLNTLGGVVGYYLAPLLQVFFPSKEDLDKMSYLKGQEVTYSRRLLAYFIDITILSVINSVLEMILTLFSLNYSLKFINIFIFIIYYAIVPVIRNKATLGQRIVKIKVVYREDKKWFSMILRAILIYVTLNLNSVFIDPLWKLIDSRESFLLIGTLFLLFIQLFWSLFFAIHIFYTSRKGHHLFYDTLSKTHVESTLTRESNNL